MNGKGIAIVSAMLLATYLVFGKSKSNAVTYNATPVGDSQEYQASDGSAGVSINLTDIGSNGQAGFEYTVFLNNGNGTLINVFTDTILAGDAGYTHDLGTAAVVVTPLPDQGQVMISVFGKNPARKLFEKTFTYLGAPA